ncbi:MAG: PspC domain-containing protein [Sphaerochaetaceae bacterium]|mgnify:CR=1 FL=1|jgi:phage shock protein PspC (stress-responsive transcriptional regulator)|nr:PspC domain-containing protein [Sphaerochaetaceae bacterium]MDD4763584.1 PspC domain-containing protein [Sphaerochaetaceae bacterium]
MKKLYRSRNGKVFGVCQGFADWRELPVDIIRLIVIVAILTTGFFPGVVIYALLALIIPIEPAFNDTSSREKVFGTYAHPSGKSYDNFAKESTINKEREWDKRFYEGAV